MTRPTLLMLPGMLNTDAVFARVAPLLRPHADVHLAGALVSGSLADMAGQALAAITAPRVAVAGFSMGGYVALEMLAASPERIAGLALIASSVAVEDDAGRQVREKWIKAAHRDFETWIERTIEFNFHPTRRQDADLQQQLREQMRQVGPDGFEAQVRATMARRDQRAMLARTTIPSAIIANRDDAVLPPAHSEAAAAMIPKATLSIIEDAGHMSVLEKPEAVAAVLIDWLARIDTATRPA